MSQIVKAPEQVLARVADFLQECEDRLDPNDDSYDHSYGTMKIWVSPRKGNLEAQVEQHINYRNAPQKPWKQ